MCVYFFRLTVFHRQHSLVVYLMSVGVCFLSTYMCLGTVGLCLDTCIHQPAVFRCYKIFSNLSDLGFNVAESMIHGCLHIPNTAVESCLHQIASLKSTGERSMRMKCRKEDFPSLHHT